MWPVPLVCSSVISRLFQNILSLFPTIHRRQSTCTTDPGLRVTYIAAVRLTPRTKAPIGTPPSNILAPIHTLLSRPHTANSLARTKENCCLGVNAGNSQTIWRFQMADPPVTMLVSIPSHGRPWLRWLEATPSCFPPPPPRHRHPIANRLRPQDAWNPPH